MINTFLFDFDGTVADTIPGILITLDKTRDAMNVFYDLDEAKSLIGTPLVAMGAALCGEERASEFVDTYRKQYNLWGADKISFYPGIEKLLKDLNRAGMTCAVVTSKRRDTLLNNLDMLNAHDYFDLLVTKESVSHFKPHPEAVEYALAGLNSEPKNAVMIGDTNYDIGCGQGAKVRTIAVTWGTEPKESLLRCHPDDIVDDANELYELCFDLIQKSKARF